MSKEYPEETSILEMCENWKKDKASNMIHYTDHLGNSPEFVLKENNLNQVEELMLIPKWEYEKLKAMQERVEDSEFLQDIIELNCYGKFPETKVLSIMEFIKTGNKFEDHY
jgi:hypothetical protein